MRVKGCAHEPNSAVTRTTLSFGLGGYQTVVGYHEFIISLNHHLFCQINNVAVQNLYINSIKKWSLKVFEAVKHDCGLDYGYIVSASVNRLSFSVV